MVIRDFTKFLKEYFVVTRDLVGAEIGVRKGVNALEMSEYLKPKMLVLVDAWNETIERGDLHYAVYLNGSIDKNEPQELYLLSTYKKFADRTNVIIIKGTSQQVSLLLRHGVFDFVYIDAAHDYKSVGDDIAGWSILVRNNGIIGGHDYHMPDVAKAVNEAFPDTKIYVGIERPQQGVDWWVIKH